MKTTNKPDLAIVEKLLKKVKHPAIDSTLFELGILKEVTVEEDKIKIELAFPAANIPIKDVLIQQVKESLVNLKAEVEVKTTVMDKETLQKFFSLEQQNWKN
ncbi:MAG: iron-sulfur cluster assembly protein [Patescibacteria group bacterium]|nr:iron-sulfur cluster assembly protein [Patescibacteria group bacterium]